MNAAARLVYQEGLSRQLLFLFQFNLRQGITLAFMVAMLLSSLALISVTHSARILRAEYQQYLTEQDKLHVEQGQLLLERSTWMMQNRIQEVAEKKLDMILPDRHSIVVVHRE